jgi:phosphatidylinositol dimannoside acyltransferase
VRGGRMGRGAGSLGTGRGRSPWGEGRREEDWPAVLRERLTNAAFGVGWVLVCRVPESWARAAFMLGADIGWRRQGHGVQVLEGNLRRVIGADAGNGELRALSRKVMRSYARYYLEDFRLHVIPRERLLGRGVYLEGADNLERSLEYLKNGRGVIFALPHMGNVEQAGAWVIANGAGSFTTVAERLAVEPVYERWLKFRQGLGFEVVPTTGGPRPFGVLAQRLRAGHLVCMLADRDLSDTGVEVDFFGEKALMAAGSAVLAVRTGAALTPASCWFVGDTGWGIRVHDEIPVPEQGNPKEKVTVMLQQLAVVFEQAIKEHPEDWHMLQRVFVADLDRERLKAARNDTADTNPDEVFGT